MTNSMPYNEAMILQAITNNDLTNLTVSEKIELTSAYRNNGLLEKALKTIQDVLGLELNDLEKASALELLGGIHLDLEQLKEAESNFKQAIQLYGSSLVGIRVKTFLGMVYSKQGKYNQAIEYLQNLKNMDLDPETRADIHTTLGNALLERRDVGDAKAALDELQEALNCRLQLLTKDDWRLYDTHNDLARAYVENENFNQAKVHYQTALTLLEPWASPNDLRLATIRLNLGQMLEPEVSLKAMLPYWKARQRYQHELSGTLNTTQRRNLNNQEMDRLSILFHTLTQTLTPEAINSEAINNVYAVWLNHKGSATALESSYTHLSHQHPETQEVLNALRDASLELSRAYQTPFMDTKNLEEKITKLEQELQEKLRDKPEFLQLRNIQPEQITACLKSDEILIDYAVLEDQTFAFVLQKDTELKFFELGSSKTILEHLKNLRLDIEKFVEIPLEKLHNRQSAQVLSQTLLTPLQIPKHAEIIISADANLHFTPFDLLPYKNKSLLEHHNTRFIPTPRDLLRLQNQNTQLQSAVLIGAPDYNLSPQESNNTSDLLEPENPPENTQKDPWESQYEKLETLKPHLEKLHKKLEKQNIQSTLFTGEYASVQNLEQISNPSILHIATHCEFIPVTKDTDPPARHDPLNRCFLAMAGINQQNHKTDLPNGIFTARQLAALNLHGTIISLTGCKSALGDTTPTDTPINFIHAAFSAGACYVISTIWSVYTVPTIWFMNKFYENLLQNPNHDVPTAFYKTKKEMQTLSLENPPWKNENYKMSASGLNIPYHWAAFVLHGK